MRQPCRLANRSIFTIRAEKIEWLLKKPVEAPSLTIAASILEPVGSARRDRGLGKLVEDRCRVRRHLGDDRIARDALDITSAVRQVSKEHSQLRLPVLGGNWTETVPRSGLRSQERALLSIFSG